MGAILTPVQRSSERGAELVEFALILPVLMLIFLGIAAFGLYRFMGPTPGLLGRSFTSVNIRTVATMRTEVMAAG